MYPPYQNTGTPVGLNTLKAGDKYRGDGYPSEYTVLARMDSYLKIKRSDSWIINLAYENPAYKQIVYVDR